MKALLELLYYFNFPESSIDIKTHKNQFTVFNKKTGKINDTIKFVYDNNIILIYTNSYGELFYISCAYKGQDTGVFSYYLYKKSKHIHYPHSAKYAMKMFPDFYDFCNEYIIQETQLQMYCS